MLTIHIILFFGYIFPHNQQPVCLFFVIHHTLLCAFVMHTNDTIFCTESTIGMPVHHSSHIPRALSSVNNMATKFGYLQLPISAFNSIQHI